MSVSPLVRILVAIGAFQAAFFLGWTALTVHVLAAGWTPAAVGALAAVPWVGVLATMPFVTRLARRHGLRRMVLASTACHGAAALALALDLPWPGAALLGAGFGLRWAALDTWLLSLASRANVGRIVGLVETVAGGAMVAGPLLADALPGGTLLAPALALALLVAVALACVATLPAPVHDASTPAPVAHPLRPLLVVVALGALAGGAFESGFMATGAMLAERAGQLGAALRLDAYIGAGSFLAMIPLGWCADRFGAGLVLRATSFGLIVTLAVLLLWPAALMPVGFAMGAAGGGLYTIAIAYGAGRVAPTDVTAVVAAGAAAYTVGSLVLPPVTGALLEIVSTQTTVAVLLAAAICAALALRAALALATLARA